MPEFSFMSPTEFRRPQIRILRHTRLVLVLAVVAIITTTCSTSRGGSSGIWTQASFVDSTTSALKPSIILILPQSFKVPTHQQVQASDQQTNTPAAGDSTRLQQYVALINNVQNERDDQLLRQQYKKLTLQVRDANSPITGQLFYEQVFDYFEPRNHHLLVPINLDQVSPVQEQLSTASLSYAGALTNSEPKVVAIPRQLIVSIRPYQIDSGFGSDSIEFVSSAPVPVESVPSSDGRRSFAIVQTDKPVYKPDEKVHIRSLVINENLRPIINDELRLQIKNPHKIIVEEVRFPRATNESEPSDNKFARNDEPLFLDHLFEFPPEPMLGTWTVNLLHNDPVANDTVNFEVREYVLPTFEIEFDTPKYVLPGTQNIIGSIIAKYHYGKPVQGKAQFKFGFKESATAKPRFVARTSIKTINPTTGRVEYNVPPDKFKEISWFPDVSGYRLVVEATVTEMTTGHREVAQDTSCTFISMPYKVSFEESIDDFKPGLSQQFTVQVLEIQTERPVKAGTRIVAQYKDQNGTMLNQQWLIANNQPVDFRNRLDEEAYTDSLGRATFTIGPVRDDITSIQATIRWLNSTYQNVNGATDPAASSSIPLNDLAIGYHTMVKHESRNGWISLMNKTITQLNVGDEFVSDLLIRDAVVIPQKIFYIISARSHILALETLNSDGLVKFSIKETMIPSIRVVLFALTHDSVGLLSDSMRINVGHDMGCGLTVRYKSNGIGALDPKAGENTFKPNDQGKLAIKARQGDLVSLIGVDSAVYTLNNRSRLESSKIVERVKRLDSGCGFGGGRNNLDVFHNAGLMFSKNVANVDPNESMMNQIGSSCMTVTNQLRYLEDIQRGYSRPMFSAAAQLSNRPRALESALAVRQKIAASSTAAGGADSRGLMRSKREVDVEAILRRYKDPLYKSCCRLGTLEDLPQQRDCSVRARIVAKYMRQVEFRSCSQIYFDCCRAVFGTRELEVVLGSMISPRDHSEVFTERKISPTHQAPQYSEAVFTNVGHLDRIESQTLVRKDFRETWLFELVSVDQDDGSASLEVKLPHSITGWSISAMALNRYQPMCIMARPLRLTTFQEIFLHVSVPYKVIQGEQIDLVATIFNYSPLSQEVLVYMYGVEDLCSEAEPGERSDRKRVRIEKNASQSVLFPMIPLKTGKYRIKILAITPSSGGSDIVERHLNVVPRGKPVIDEITFSLDPMNHQRRSKRAIQTGNLLDEIDSSKGLQRSKVRLTPSRDSEYIVPQTQECIVSAIGDKMGQTVQTSMIDVENLIRLPHGCGEQVMIYMGPTLYTARYLSSINKLTGDLRWRAIRYIQSGYKRILNYRKENGAFSAFARRDASIWLTAFISKMLCQTERTPFITEEIHVDRTVVNSALNWLADIQNKETGTWVELNPVYHREMLGGVLKENALTAFVTLSLNECAHHSPDLIDEIEEGPSPSDKRDSASARQQDFNHGQFNGVDKLKRATLKAEQALLLDRYKAVKERNPYVLALTAYSLSFSRPREAAEILDDLMLFAERSQSRNQLSWRGDYPIETAAYALQALIELAPVISSTNTASGSKPNWSPGSDAIAIANWLTSRRSFTGAFESTQDTVVALEALSKFAQLQSTPNGNSLIPQPPSSSSPSLMCNVTISNRTRRSIEFGKDNSQVLQTFKLESFDIDPMNGEMLDIVTSGTGLGTMSVKLKYNVFQEEDELCRFNIDSTIEEWRPKIPLSAFSGPPGGDSMSSAMKKTANENQSSETMIEDDYFKTFDKSMLSELNVVDLNQMDNHNHHQQPQQSPTAPSTRARKEELRFKRSALRMLDLSSKNDTSSTPESWTSKVVSTFKAKLPSWLTPGSKTTTPSPTTAAPALALAGTTPQYRDQRDGSPDNTGSYLSDAPRRTNTSRRSTQPGTVPLVVHPSAGSAGMTAGAKLNSLSKELDIGARNETEPSGNLSSQQQAQQVLGHHSSRLVLLLRVCVHHMSTRRDSEMAVIEVGVLSGFKPNEADLKEIMNDTGTPAMKYELSADKSLVIIYMRYIPFSGPYCLQFRLVRDSLVYNLQSGYIRVYEYYSPTHSCSNFYTSSRVTDLLETRCDSSGQVCQCASKSMCPGTNKLTDLGEIHSVNATSARSRLIELVCSDRFDFVSLVRLKSVRHLEAGKIFKLAVKVKSDLKGNLTKIMEAQRQQKAQLKNSVRKPQNSPIALPGDLNLGGLQTADKGSSEDEEEETSLDYLNLNIDSNCVRNDHLLLHLAHPNQWKQGGELMILFGRYSKLEKRFFKTTLKPGLSTTQFPRPKPHVLSGVQDPAAGSGRDDKVREAQFAAAAALFEDAHQQQYSTTMLLDKDSILHDMAYQARIEPRATINNVILWFDLRSRREKWACPSAGAIAVAAA